MIFTREEFVEIEFDQHHDGTIERQLLIADLFGIEVQLVRLNEFWGFLGLFEQVPGFSAGHVLNYSHNENLFLDCVHRDEVEWVCVEHEFVRLDAIQAEHVLYFEVSHPNSALGDAQGAAELAVHLYLV